MIVESCDRPSEVRRWAYRLMLCLMLVIGVQLSHKLDEALKENELTSQRFSAAITDSDQALWSWIVPGSDEAEWPESALWTDSNFDRVLGREDMPRIDKLGHMLELIYPEDRDTVMQAVRDAAKKMKSFAVDCQIRNGEGKYLWVRTRGGLSVIGGNLTVSGSIVNVTREKTERLRAEMIVKSAQRAIIMCDEDRKITMFNDKASEMFGLKPADIIGGSTDWLLVPADRPAHIAACNAAVERLKLEKSDTYFAHNGIMTTAMRAGGNGVPPGQFPVRIDVRGISYRGKIEFLAIIYPGDEPPRPPPGPPEIKPLELEQNKIDQKVQAAVTEPPEIFR